MKVIQTTKRIQKMHSMRQALVLICFVTLVSFVMMPVNAAETDQPEADDAYATVHNLQQSLIQAMRQGEQQDFSERVALLTPVIEKTHDIELIIKTILGATLWHRLNAEQQDMIVELFCKLSIATYAGRFKQYNEEQFEYLEQRDLPRDQKLVRSKLITGDGDTINFDYVLHNHPEKGWLIVNILFDGVSDLAIKRTEYRSVIQRDGFQPLMAMLQTKITEAEHNE